MELFCLKNVLDCDDPSRIVNETSKLSDALSTYKKLSDPNPSEMGRKDMLSAKTLQNQVVHKLRRSIKIIK